VVCMAQRQRPVHEASLAGRSVFALAPAADAGARAARRRGHSTRSFRARWLTTVCLTSLVATMKSHYKFVLAPTSNDKGNVGHME
jgi:hypothetical protein